jgi:hypothetical protein
MSAPYSPKPPLPIRETIQPAPSRRVDPLVWAAAEHIPPMGSVWPESERKRWIALVEAILEYLWPYPAPSDAVRRPAAAEAPPEPAPADAKPAPLTPEWYAARSRAGAAARLAKLSPERRREIALNASKAAQEKRRREREAAQIAASVQEG